MNVLPTEDSSSNTPDKQKLEAFSPSHELLDAQLKHPREQAQYLKNLVDKTSPVDEQEIKMIKDELHFYSDWVNDSIKVIDAQYQPIVTSAPELFPQRSELLFHKINRFVMPQWNRLFVSPRSPKMDAFDLETAQIQLAIEGVSILSAKNELNEELSNNELINIEAMINLLVMPIEAEQRKQPSIIVIPHPDIGTEDTTADFLVYEQGADGTFNKREVRTTDMVDPLLKPGTVAMEVLKNLRINTISRRPEFQDKRAFHDLILARQAIKNFNQE